MHLAEVRVRELLRARGVYVKSACDQCGTLIHFANRFTRKDDPGVSCSRLCRDGAETAPRKQKGGRPRLYQNDVQQRAANARRQRNFRQRIQVVADVTKTALQIVENTGRAHVKNGPLALPDQEANRGAQNGAV